MFINVKEHFSAKGDNATDDTNAIQAAINAAPEGATVFFPVGKYKVSSTIFVDDTITLRGEGMGGNGSINGGSILRWYGADSGVILHVNNPSTAPTVESVYIYNMAVDGRNVLGVDGIILGGGTGIFNRDFVGKIEGCWIYRCSGNGIECKNALNSTIDSCHIRECGVGMNFTSGTNHLNYGNNITNCIANTCDIGFKANNLRGSSFVSCTARDNRDQGFLFQCADVDYLIQGVSLDNCTLYNNCTNLVSGMGELETSTLESNQVELVINNINIENSPKANQYSMLFNAAFVSLNNPFFKSGAGDGCGVGAAGPPTVLTAKVNQAPSTYFNYVSGASSAFAWIERTVTGGGLQPKEELWLIKNHEPRLVQERRDQWLIMGDRADDAITKQFRMGAYHYTASEQPAAMVLGTMTSTQNITNIGGGSSLLNAATDVQIYAASNNTTVTGTRIVQVDDTGMDVQVGKLDVSSGRLQINTSTSMYSETAAPTSGGYNKGDIVWNSSPSGGGKAGWICTTGGTPGTWKAFAVIDA